MIGALKILFSSRGFLWAVGILLLIHLSIWSVLVLSKQHSKKQMYILGSSFIGNYRMEHGNRIQDYLSDGLQDWNVSNYAEPGARPLDLVLQYFKASLFEQSPSLVIVSVAPFYGRPITQRLDQRGDNLKWLPLSMWNSDVVQTFNGEYLKKWLFHKAGLAFGFVDLLRELWIEYLQWPRERRELREGQPKRLEKIRTVAKRVGENVHTYERNLFQENRTSEELYYRFNETRPVQDLGLTLETLKKEKVPVIVLMLPIGRPDLLQEYFSEKSKENMYRNLKFFRKFLIEKKVSYIDFNAEELYKEFPASYWDDLNHIKDPKGNQVIAREIFQKMKQLGM